MVYMSKHLRWVNLVLPMVLMLSGCGSRSGVEAAGAGGAAESSGTIANMDGTWKKVTPEEAKTVCKEKACEPNYLYRTAVFNGRGQDSGEPEGLSNDLANRWGKTEGNLRGGPGSSRLRVISRGERVNISSADYVDASKTNILKVDEVWQITEGSPEIVVAVIDSGVDINHPDLRNNIWVNEAEANGQPGVDDDGNGYVDDVHGWNFVEDSPDVYGSNYHGTHVAGIIAAARDNRGVVGLAPKVKVMPLKFIGDDGTGDTLSARKAIDYAVSKGAHIISNSWGGRGKSSLLNEAIQAAVRKGILVVAAAGNSDGENPPSNNDYYPEYPANFSNVLAVASSTADDELSSFSNYGRRTVEIAAPGTDILSTKTNGTYGFLSGTSMATPQVSAALALGLSLNPNLTSTQLLSRLCSSSHRIFLDYVRCGRLDVVKFLHSVQ